MNAANNYYTKDSPPPSISIISLVKNILKDSDISVHASNILAQLVLASGYQGCCWLLISTISKNSRLGRTQTKLYLKELETKKRIKVHHRPGRSSRFEVLDITNKFNKVSRSTDHIKEYKNKENVIGGTNVVLNLSEKTSPVTHSDCGPTEQFIETETPPILANRNKIIITKPIPPSNTEVQKPTKIPSNIIDMTLVQQILDITNDKKSTACFIKIVKNVPKDIIFAALSSLKISMEENYILRPGAYFVSTIKNYYPDLFFSPKTSSERPVTKNNNIVVPLGTSRKQYLEPEDNVVVPASQEFAMESISAIKSMLDNQRRWINLR